MLDNLINALIKAQNNIGNAEKDAKNPYFKSNYATLEAVIGAVKQPLLDEGIIFMQKSEPNETGVSMETIFYGHGGKISAGAIYVPADKQDPQGFGSALTYARRYSLATACGIGSGIKVVETATVEHSGADDDGNKATDSYKKKKDNVAKPKSKLHEPAEPASYAEGKYAILSPTGTRIVSTDEPDSFLKHCRSFIHDPSDKKCQELYKKNVEAIKLAHKDAKIETKQALAGMIKLYEA